MSQTLRAVLNVVVGDVQAYGTKRGWSLSVAPLERAEEVGGGGGGGGLVPRANKSSRIR